MQRFNKQMIVLVFMFVAIAAISFASCGNQAQQAPATDTDSIEEVVDTLAADTVAADTAAVAE